MRIFKVSGAGGLSLVLSMLAPVAFAGDAKPVAFGVDARDSGSALTRYLPRLAEPAPTQAGVLCLTNPAGKDLELVALQSDSGVLEVVVTNAHDRSSASLAKDCMLTAPIPNSPMVREVVAAR